MVSELYIQHRPEEQRFVAVMDSFEAEVSYSKISEQTLSYDHIFVPDTLRGGGIAGKLTRFALDHARKNGLRVRPVCPLVKQYVDRHPEYQEITVQED